MRKLAKRIPLVLVLGLLAAIAATGSASAAPHLDGTFKIPGVETNNKIVAGPDGNVWLTTASVVGEDVVKVNPDGKFEMFELKGVMGATGIAVGPGGTMWVVSPEQITSFSVDDPVKSAKTVPVAALKAPQAIVTGPEGQLWVAAQEAVFHFAPANAATPTEIKVPGLAGKDIDVAGSQIVVADSGAGNKVWTFTAAGAGPSFAIPGPSQGVAGSPSGQIAFSAPGASPEQAGLITPPNPASTFELLDDPTGVAYGPDKAFWIARFASGSLERVTSTGAHTTAITGLPKESARQIAAGPDNTLWVTLVKMGEEGVAKISGVEIAVPQTTLTKGPPKVVRKGRKPAKVTFRFSSSIEGSTFECALTKLRKGKKTPAPLYRACSSPRKFTLGVGSYRVLIRAVNEGVPDASPVQKNFRVVRIVKKHRPHKRHHK